MDVSSFVLPLHLFTLAFIAWTIFQADHMAFAWIRGKVKILEKNTIRKYHRRTWYGLIGMIVTGLLLFWPMREYLLTRPQFFIKMAFVVTLLVNGFVIGYLQDVAVNKEFKQLTFTEKLPLFISGGISTFAWVGAAITAFFLLP